MNLSCNSDVHLESMFVHSKFLDVALYVGVHSFAHVHFPCQVQELHVYIHCWAPNSMDGDFLLQRLIKIQSPMH